MVAVDVLYPTRPPPPEPDVVTLPVAADCATPPSFHPTNPPTSLAPCTATAALSSLSDPAFHPTKPPTRLPVAVTVPVLDEPETVALAATAPANPPISLTPLTVTLESLDVVMLPLPMSYPARPPT